jgi:hypothetical protein
LVIDKVTTEGKVIARTVGIWRRMKPTGDEIAV